MYEDLENCLDNTYKTINGLIDHLKIEEKQKDFWTVRLAEAICNFEHALDSEKNEADCETQRIALQIQNFSRSIKRQPKTSTLNKRWQQLPTAAHIFINFHLKSISNRFIDFEDLDLTIYADQKLLSEATNRAKKWVQKKRGYSHDYPTVDRAGAVGSRKWRVENRTLR